jgi:hypothetical protein
VQISSEIKKTPRGLVYFLPIMSLQYLRQVSRTWKSCAASPVRYDTNSARSASVARSRFQNDGKGEALRPAFPGCDLVGYLSLETIAMTCRCGLVPVIAVVNGVLSACRAGFAQSIIVVAFGCDDWIAALSASITRVIKGWCRVVAERHPFSFHTLRAINSRLNFDMVGRANVHRIIPFCLNVITVYTNQKRMSSPNYCEKVTVA